MAEVNDSLFDAFIDGEPIALTLGSWGKDEHLQVKKEPPERTWRIKASLSLLSRISGVR